MEQKERKRRVLSEETKEKIRAAKLGKRQSEEAKRKISEANKRRKRSEITKQKISEAQRGKSKVKQRFKKECKKSQE